MFDQLISITLKNGETITYRDSNYMTDKAPLVLIHGNMSSSFHFNKVFESLGQEYRIIAPDLRGFGGSTYHSPIHRLADFAYDVGELLAQLCLSDCVVLGWSTGGGVAMELAIRYPSLVSKLILVESVGIMGYPMFKKNALGQPIPGEFLSTKEDIANDPVQVIPILNAQITKDKELFRAVWNAVIYTHNKPEEDLYNQYLEDMLTQRNLVDVDYALVHFNISDKHNGVELGTNRIAEIKIPTRIYQGQRDFVVPSEMGEGIYEALKEHAIYVTGDFGHSPFVDCFDQLIQDIKSDIELSTSPIDLSV